MQMATSFECYWVIRGYNIYGDWGSQLHCMRETGNSFDLFAVAVVSDGEIIGHVPKLISAAASSQFQRWA